MKDVAIGIKDKKKKMKKTIKCLFKLIRKDTTPIETYIEHGVECVDNYLKGSVKNDFGNFTKRNDRCYEGKK